MEATSSLYKGRRYPGEIISHCVWLYHRFPLSVREVEEMMMARGVLVTYETIHQWCRKFGQAFANGLRRRRPRPGDQRNLDEVFIKISGISPHFRPRRHRLTATQYRHEMTTRFTTWNEVVGLPTTA